MSVALCRVLMMAGWQGSEAALQALASDSGGQDLINVNNQLVPASTPLSNGDYVVFSKQRLDTHCSDG